MKLKGSRSEKMTGAEILAWSVIFIIIIGIIVLGSAGGAWAAIDAGIM